MKKFIFGNNVFTPLDTVLGIDCGTTDQIHVTCLNHNKEAGGATGGLNNSEYVITVTAGSNIEVATALIETMNFGKLEIIDLSAFNSKVSSVTFAATPS
jgi:hypothetical protein